MKHKLTEIGQILEKLPDARQRKIRKRSAELVAIEQTMQELRKNREVTQDQLAEILGVGQDSISRIESRTDFKLSTLQSYIKALGGKLRLVAEFPDVEPIVLNISKT